MSLGWFIKREGRVQCDTVSRPSVGFKIQIGRSKSFRILVFDFAVLIADDVYFDAAVDDVAVHGVIFGFRAVEAVADGFESVFGDAFADEIFEHGVGAIGGEFLIVIAFGGGAFVGVTFDYRAGFGGADEDIRDLVELVEIRGFDDAFVGVEFDVANEHGFVVGVAVFDFHDVIYRVVADKGAGVIRDAVAGEAVDEADVEGLVEFGVVSGDVCAGVESQGPLVIDVVHDARAGADVGGERAVACDVLAVESRADTDGQVGVDFFEAGDVEERVRVNLREECAVEIIRAAVAFAEGEAFFVFAPDTVVVLIDFTADIFFHVRGEEERAFKRPPFVVIVTDAECEVGSVFEGFVAFENINTDGGAEVPATVIGFFLQRLRR